MTNCKTINIVVDVTITILVLFIIILCLRETKVFRDIIENFVPEKCLDDSYLTVIRDRIKQLFDHKQGQWSGALSALNTDKKDILDDLTFCKGESSYTINKTKVYICMYNENNERYSENMLMHVVLHELSHAICTSVGHTKEFDTIFTELMDEAHDFGIYDKHDELEDNYCGTSKNDAYVIESSLN